MGKLDFLFLGSLPVAMEGSQMLAALTHMMLPAPQSQAGELFACPSQTCCHSELYVGGGGGGN